MNLRDVAAIVTGGASGLGAATARLLAEQGAKVTIFDLDEQTGTAEAQRIGGLFCKVNVADRAEVANAIEHGEQRHGVARVLVNCAGISTVRKTVGLENDPHPVDLFRRTIEVNLMGTFNMISQFAARLAAWPTDEEERGVIVNTASVSAFDGQVGPGGVRREQGGRRQPDLASRARPDDAPYPRDDDRSGPFLDADDAGAAVGRAGFTGQTGAASSRLGRPEEYARMVGAIVANPMLNGEVIRLDGAIRMAPR